MAVVQRDLGRFGIVVTRPGAAGSALVADLVAHGAAAVAAPAFTLGPPPDEAATASVLARLSAFDLAVFVSPAAARAVAQRLSGAWPAHTAIGAVGAATAETIDRLIEGARSAPHVVPDVDTEDAGSEAFWVALVRAGLVPAAAGSGDATGAAPAPEPARAAARRVLLLRAETGRDWLSDRLAAAGVQVEAQAVYTRRPNVPDALALAAMRTWCEGARRAVLVVTSSEAIDVVEARWGAQREVATTGVRAWLRAGLVLAAHRRVAERARTAGYGDVRLTPAVAADVLEALR